MYWLSPYTQDDISVTPLYKASKLHTNFVLRLHMGQFSSRNAKGENNIWNDDKCTSLQLIINDLIVEN